MIRGYEFPCILLALARKFRAFFPGIYWNLRSKLLIKLSGIKVGKDLNVYGRLYINNRRKDEIVIGSNVVLQSRFANNFVGLLNPSVLDTLGGGKIWIGDDSGLSSVIISSRSMVQIGRFVKIGGNVRIFDHDFHSLNSETRRTSKDHLHIKTKSVYIEDDVFIGTNAIILKGTRLGTRSIVAAGSVVFGLDVPPDSLVKGNPAKIIINKG
ncbi:MAG: acyltransferase [Bacteroidales bacterium]|nr:acyltransferase [Bacteroidales bacterium]